MNTTKPTPQRKDSQASQNASDPQQKRSDAGSAKNSTAENGSPALRSSALYPGKPGFTPSTKPAVGGVILLGDDIEYNTGRKTVKLTVRNTGDRPIQVGSHFHFFEVNRYLEFDRDDSFGCHLNIPATTAIRFEPGDQKDVEVVTYAGKRRVIGFNGLVMGYTGEEDAPTYFPARLRALRKVRHAGFKISSSDLQAIPGKAVHESGKSQNNGK